MVCRSPQESAEIYEEYLMVCMSPQESSLTPSYALLTSWCVRGYQGPIVRRSPQNSGWYLHADRPKQLVHICPFDHVLMAKIPPGAG